MWSFIALMATKSPAFRPLFSWILPFCLQERQASSHPIHSPSTPVQHPDGSSVFQTCRQVWAFQPEPLEKIVFHPAAQNLIAFLIFSLPAINDAADHENIQSLFQVPHTTWLHVQCWHYIPQTDYRLHKAESSCISSKNLQPFNCFWWLPVIRLWSSRGEITAGMLPVQLNPVLLFKWPFSLAIFQRTFAFPMTVVRIQTCTG